MSKHSFHDTHAEMANYSASRPQEANLSPSPTRISAPSPMAVGVETFRRIFGDSKPPDISRKISACAACRKQKVSKRPRNSQRMLGDEKTRDLARARKQMLIKTIDKMSHEEF